MRCIACVLVCAELIEEARRRMQCTGSMRRETSIVLEGLLGEGTFGKVYRGSCLQLIPSCLATVVQPESQDTFL